MCMHCVDIVVIHGPITIFNNSLVYWIAILFEIKFIIVL